MSEAASAYTIRPFQPGDEVEIYACVRECYGDTYVVHKELYHPQQIARLNASGRLVSVVAVAPPSTEGRQAGGAIVGHYAIERPDLGIIGETGEAMVHPEHRHHQLFERMRPVLVEAGRRLGMVGLFGLPVTNHTFSQRMYEHFEGRPCGVNLGIDPKTFHNTAEPPTQRPSTLLYFQFLSRPEKAVAHVPPRHRDVVGRIYQQFGVAAEFPDVPAEAEGTEELDIDYFPELGYGVIRVREGGPEAAAAVRRARRNLCLTQGAEAVYLELPLSQPATAALCDEAEADGFFFSGIGPCFAADGDALRLQYLAVPLDAGQLQVENPFARELLAYVEAERRRG
jgi:hypothetical protein